MPRLEEVVQDYQRNKSQRNVGIMSMIGGAGILALISPTLIEHWKSPLDGYMIAADLFVSLPALGAVVAGGFYAGRAMYRSAKITKYYPKRERFE